jgi:hypothetical protein
MITIIPDRPPTWLRLLAMSSAILGGLLGALLLSFTIDFHRSEYTVSRKYVSDHGDQYRIFAEVFPGGSSIDKFISTAFLPLLLLQRFRRAWVRGICYPIGGLLASLITLYAVLGIFGTA